MFRLYAGLFFALAGREDSLRLVIDELDRQPAGTYVSPLARAVLEAYLDEKDRSYDLYGRAIDGLDASLPYIGFFPPPPGILETAMYGELLDRIVPENPWKHARYSGTGRLLNAGELTR